MPEDNHETPDELIRPKVARTEYAGGINPTTLWTWIKKGKFPAPVVSNPGERREIVAFRKSDLVRWQQSLPQRQAVPVSEHAYSSRRAKAQSRDDATSVVRKLARP